MPIFTKALSSMNLLSRISSVTVSDTATCTINGDYLLKNGVLESINIRNPKGGLRVCDFMKYESTIAITNRTFARSPTMDVEVLVPLHFFEERVETLLANLAGRLYLTGYTVDALRQSNGSRRKPIIEVVLLHQYPPSVETNEFGDVYIPPVIELTGRVMSEPRLYHDDPNWYRLDIKTGTFFRGEYTEMEFR